MAKTKISEYSSTASNNTDIDGISIAEGMAPSNVNNAIRELMSQLKDWQSGSVSQDMSVNGAFTATGNAVLSADLTVGDDLTVTGDASVGGAFTCTGVAVLSSNLSVAGTLSAGATSLGAVTFSGATVMSSTLSVTGDATVGSSTTNSHTLNGSLTVGTSTSNTVTLNTLLSAGGGTGTSGQVLKSNGTASAPSWTSLSSLTDFGSSITSDGYQKLPGGLIIQWGRAEDTATNKSFPLEFPNACFVLVGTDNNDSYTDNAVAAFIVSKSQFRLRCGNAANAGAYIYWIAIGY
jgi:hypothetical protein